MPNPQQLKDLSLRDGVSTKVLALLGRARGLDILLPDEFVADRLDRRPVYQALARGEEDMGVHIAADEPRPFRLVYVIEYVYYPVPGFPSAYHAPLCWDKYPCEWPACGCA